MLFTAQILALSDSQRVSQGSVRHVYEFPGQPDLLIKVFHAFDQRSSRRKIKRLAWRLFPSLRFRSILNELKCEMLVSLRLGADIAHMPLSRMLGVVQTDRGAGVVVARITGLDGGLAPKLHAFIHEGRLDDPVLQALNAFVKRMYDLQIVARDINASNIVFGTRGQGAECFLIDGYGERNLIPLRSMSRTLNARSLNRQFAEIAERTGLVWDPRSRRFSNSRA